MIHCIQKAIEDEEIFIKHVETGDQLAGILTKAFECNNLFILVNYWGMTNKKFRRNVKFNV